MEIQDLTFDFSTMLTILTIVVAGLSSLFYFRSAFKTNATEINGRIAAMEALGAVDRENFTNALGEIGKKVDLVQGGINHLHTEMVRIGGEHKVINTRLDNVEARMPQAGAG